MKSLFWSEIKIVVAWFIGNLLLLLLIAQLDTLKALDVLLYFCFLSTISFLILIGYLFIQQRKFLRFLNEEEPACCPKSLGETAMLKRVHQQFVYQQQQAQEQLLAFQNQNRENQLFINKWVHYIKTPLSVIRMTTQEDENNEQLQQIQEESDKILHGVNMALYFARSTNFATDFKFEQLSLRATLIEVVNELKRLFIKKEVFPILEIPEAITIVSDKSWLKVIFYQLITNAVKYSYKGGKIKIFIRNNKEGLWGCVKDTGKGIPEQDQARVFDLFFTGRNGREYGESTGIGLFLVKKICTQLSYTIALESKEREGTTFSVRLKAAPSTHNEK